MTMPIELYKSDAISSKEEDALGRRPFIEAVANFIKSQATEVNKEEKKELRNLGDPLTIGIYGKWGYGKTSVIRCVETEIKNQFFTAYYNPWMYNNEEDLIKHLFETIISSVKGTRNKTKRNRLTKSIGKYFLHFIKGFKADVKFGTNLAPIQPTVGVNLQSFADELLKDIDKEETIYDVKEEINKVLSSLSNPIVIFIDDIDRLSKTEIYTLFKTVRLIADFKNIIYVLSFDDEMVAKSIKDKFADGNNYDGFSYLEKIIDIPLRLPVYNKSSIKVYLRSKIKFNEDSIPYFDELFDFVVDEVVATPRQCLRVVNSVSFLRSSLKHLSNQHLFILEAIRLNRPDVYNILELYHTYVIRQQNPKYFFNLKKDVLLREYNGQEDNSNRIAAFMPELSSFFEKLFLINVLGNMEILMFNPDGTLRSSGRSLLMNISYNSDGALTSTLLDKYMRFVKNLD